MSTDAQRKAAKKYLGEMKTVTFRITPQKYTEILSHANTCGKSVNAYLLDAVNLFMKQDSADSSEVQ